MLLVLPYSGELSGTLYKGQQKLNMYKLTIYKMIFSTCELKNNVIKLIITNEDVKMIFFKKSLDKLGDNTAISSAKTLAACKEVITDNP